MTYLWHYMSCTPRLGRGKTIALRVLYGMDVQVTARDQDGLTESSINYTAVAYQTCATRMCYQHSVLRASHSCECTVLQHDGMTGRDTCALSIVDLHMIPFDMRKIVCNQLYMASRLAVVLIILSQGSNDHLSSLSLSSSSSTSWACISKARFPLPELAARVNGPS